MLRETKTKSKKFRIRWSKVPRVLEPLKSNYGLFSHPAGHGRFKPKNTQNGNKSRFPGRFGATCHFQAGQSVPAVAREMLRKTKSKKFRIRWSKVPRVLEPLKSSYGHFSHPAGHGRGKFSSRKTPKMAINRAVVLTIGCGISCSSFLSLATVAENARSPGKSRFIAILGVFRLETAVASRVTKMAMTRF